MFLHVYKYSYTNTYIYIYVYFIHIHLRVQKQSAFLRTQLCVKLLLFQEFLLFGANCAIFFVFEHFLELVERCA